MTQFVYCQHKSIVGGAAKSRLPAMYAAREFVEDGGLMSYGASLPDLFRRAATYVDKILKGANPADLPVEQPTKLELVFNLKTAKDVGLVILREFLLLADEVIECTARCLFMARTGPTGSVRRCPFLGVDRKWLADGQNGAFDPTRTLTLCQGRRGLGFFYPNTGF